MFCVINSMAQIAQKVYSKYQENGTNRAKFREYYYLVTQDYRLSGGVTK